MARSSVQRIVSLYLVLGDEHVETGRQTLDRIFRQFLPNVPVTHVLVQNDQASYRENHELFDLSLLGDQSVFDFSGWDAGLKVLRDKGFLKEGDMLAFSNDSFFRTTGEKFLSYLTPELYENADPYDSVFGYVDDFPKKARIGEFEYQNWIRTCLFFIPYKFISKVGTLTTPLEYSQFFASDPKLFWTDTEILSTTFKKYIGSWLFGWEDSSFPEYKLHWKSHALPNENNFDFFKSKALTIISEHQLTARIRALNIPIVDYNLDPKLSDRHTYSYYKQSIFS